MHLVVIGAGQLGESVLALATRGRHEVVVVESRPEQAAHCAERYDARVVEADIGDDSANLMAMYLGREAGSRMLATVVNHRSHQRLFEKLGARVLVDPDLLLAAYATGPR